LLPRAASVGDLLMFRIVRDHAANHKLAKRRRESREDEANQPGLGVVDLLGRRGIESLEREGSSRNVQSDFPVVKVRYSFDATTHRCARQDFALRASV
jgi:hypothetical protein